MEERAESRPVGKEPCPSCGSKDNLARYDDGHAYCFSPGCAHYEPATDGSARSSTPRVNPYESVRFIDGAVRPLNRRGITAETCARFGYLTGKFKRQDADEEEWCQIATYRDRATGLLTCAQKLRFADKDVGMPILGKIDDAGLFGEHLWRRGGQWIVVTEGEIDAMSVSQAFPSRPVVSLKRGAKGAARDIKDSLEFLESYDKIILWFDHDDAGRRAVQDAAMLITPGKVKIVETPQ